LTHTAMDTMADAKAAGSHDCDPTCAFSGNLSLVAPLADKHPSALTGLPGQIMRRDGGALNRGSVVSTHAVEGGESNSLYTYAVVTEVPLPNTAVSAVASVNTLGHTPGKPAADNAISLASRGRKPVSAD